jgi:hypothetical protein
MEVASEAEGIALGVGSQGTLRVVGGRFTGFRVALEATRGELRVTGARFESNGTAVDIQDRASLGLVSGSRFIDDAFGVAISPGVPGLAYPDRPVYTVEGSLFEREAIAISHCYEAPCPPAATLTVANSVISHSDPGLAAVRGRGVTLVNDTLTENAGDAIRVLPDGAVTVRNTILVGAGGVRCDGVLIDGGNDLQSPGSTCGATIPAADPVLSPLLEPLAGSPALGAGDVATCDRYPVSRRDFYRRSRLVAGTCSIGAVEGPIPQPVVPTPRPEREGAHRHRSLSGGFDTQGPTRTQTAIVDDEGLIAFDDQGHRREP